MMDKGGSVGRLRDRRGTPTFSANLVFFCFCLMGIPCFFVRSASLVCCAKKDETLAWNGLNPYLISETFRRRCSLILMVYAREML